MQIFCHYQLAIRGHYAKCFPTSIVLLLNQVSESSQPRSFIHFHHCAVPKSRLFGKFIRFPLRFSPGDFVTKVKQINSQSDLIWMTSFAGPSYLTIRSLSTSFLFEILVFAIFTISAKLDPITYVRNLSNMHSTSINKQ